MNAQGTAELNVSSKIRLFLETGCGSPLTAKIPEVMEKDLHGMFTWKVFLRHHNPPIVCH